MRYIVSCISIVNDIEYRERPSEKAVLGGGVYAASGIKLWTDDVIFVTTAGPDYLDFYGDYFHKNGYSERGIVYTLPHTHHTVLRYGEDGSWEETSVFSPDYFREQYENTMNRASYITPFCDDKTRGIFIDSGATEKIFGEIDMIRRAASNAKIMWEIPTFSSENRELRELVEQNIRLFDIFSLNIPEAKSLFGTDSFEEISKKITQLGVPCFLRAGKKGAYYIDKNVCAFEPSIDVGIALDPTGCGNSSTAAALYGLCEGFTPKKLLCAANITAGCNILSKGPMQTPAEHRSLAEKLLFELSLQ
ncbi:MAG: PfkB family carbohydrate kinase [Oscillospiraceae bacterium]